MKGIIYLVTNTVTGKSYVGKTVKTLEHRWKGHCMDAERQIGFTFQRALRKYGSGVFDKQILASNVPVKELSVMEKIWIFLMGSQSPMGYNLTAGGDGIENPSKETRERKSVISRKAWASPKTRKKMVAGLRTPNCLQKVSESSAQRWRDPKYRKRLSEAHKRIWADPEKRKVIATRTPECRQRLSKLLKKFYSSFKGRQVASTNAKKLWSNPNSRRALLAIRATPEFRHKQQLKMKEKWADPSFREKMVQSMKGVPRSRRGTKC